MTTITCDICNSKISDKPFRLKLNDGEHPHNGSRMYKTVDICIPCLHEAGELQVDLEFDALVMKMSA